MNQQAGTELGAAQAMTAGYNVVLLHGGPPSVGDHLDRIAGGHDEDAMAIAERDRIRRPPGREAAPERRLSASLCSY